jgi:hypothetical protein
MTEQLAKIHNRLVQVAKAINPHRIDFKPDDFIAFSMEGDKYIKAFCFVKFKKFPGDTTTHICQASLPIRYCSVSDEEFEQYLANLRIEMEKEEDARLKKFQERYNEYTTTSNS